MTPNELRALFAQTAVGLGYTPPGWRSPRERSNPRLIDRIGDLALRVLAA